MEIALIDGVRTLPAPGLRGLCQACHKEMVAKCGDLLVWHWAHKGRRVCDPWWENEGPWHRGWKELFPVEFHEQVHFAADGEKHIADVQLPGGLVIELQHSAMSLEEMRSREAFYQRMIWIVDGAPFIKNLTIFDPLPNPALPFVEDLRFYGPHPQWRTSLRARAMSYENLMFYRESKKKPGDTMVEMESGRSLEVNFNSTHAGHFLFLWMKPREVWYQTTLPTYIDLGEGLLGRLMHYRPGIDQLWCLQIVSKGLLVRDLLDQA
jgi:competence protein CoiA